jgi:hypothetical protein
MVLSAGEMVFHGSAVDALEHYLSAVTPSGFGFVDLTQHPGRSNDYRPLIRSIGLLANSGSSRYRDSVKPGEDVVFEIKYDAEDLRLDNVVLGICSAVGERIFTVGARFSSDFKWTLTGKGTLTCCVPGLALAAGEYRVMAATGNRIQRKDIDCVEDALTFRVETVDYFGTGETLLPGQGHFAVRSEWRRISVADEVGLLT